MMFGDMDYGLIIAIKLMGNLFRAFNPFESVSNATNWIL